MVFVYDVEYDLNVCPVSKQSFCQVRCDLNERRKVGISVDMCWQHG